MGFLQKTRVVILGHLNELMDKAIDMNSIPVLKQYVRDLEAAIAVAQHQSAVGAAQVTTLTREVENIKAGIETDKRRAQAYLAQNNEKAARDVATRIHNQQDVMATINAQIEDGKTQVSVIDSAVEKMKTKHDAIFARVRELETKDRGAKALEQATASIQSAGEALSTGVDSSVDDVARRIESRSDLAKEEFGRVTADLDTPEDPLKKQAVDSILEELKSTAQAEKVA